MPINIETIADDLYLLRWEGNINLREIHDSHETTSRLAAQAGIDSYIHILDLTSMKAFPFDPTGLLNILFGYPNVFAVLVVGGSLLARSAVRVLDGASKQVAIRSYPNLASAREYALALLTEKQQGILEQ